ncbi:netrin-4-like [Hypomesus transpacificus]|uniref:netrin-4-like n=1 Tax=Hypomesus transpacificus TaxID=137520 RepID=UPI001F0855CF|nr:netrin-4-like [Hypomesus transpacificus]
MGNLVLGRRLTTQSVCGTNSTDSFCFYQQTGASYSQDSCSAPRCSKCNAAVPHQTHLPAAMTDSSFRYPDTWWQSAEGVETEMIQLDLETEFYFTHLILVFRSARPAAMVLERSQDFGQSWKILRYFARDCVGTFGLAEDTFAEENGPSCTSKYSGAFPCTQGEVIYRALPPWRSLDPYSPAAQAHLMVTNLRVRLLQRQPCPCQAKNPEAKALPMAHYAIYDFIVKGSCFCNGHSEHCVPASGYHPGRHRTNHLVHGKCVCKHHTAGNHCERCAPLYNDQPWQSANGIIGTPHECKKCKCNGHADSCHFDRRVWLASRRRGGGVCDDCLHNTEGHSCQNCKRGFYRVPRRPRAAPDSCKSCLCNAMGSLPSLSGGAALCNPSNGECPCKPGVGGSRCDRCMLGYWGFHEYGCRPCDCWGGNCDPFNGDCMSGSDMDVLFTADDHMGHSISSSSSNSEPAALFRAEELFSALHHSEKCECKEMVLSSSKLFCAMEYDYVLLVRIMSAHDKGSHAEVEVKVKKVLQQRTQVKIQRGTLTLYPESWTTRGCTCPILNPGSEYIVAGHEDWRTGHLLVNTKSLIKPWSQRHKLHPLLVKDCVRH